MVAGVPNQYHGGCYTTQLVALWGGRRLGYPISIIPLLLGYRRLPSSKSKQVAKNIWRGNIGYYCIKASFMSYFLLNYQQPTLQDKNNLSKASLVKSYEYQLVNQHSNKSDNCLRGKIHKPAQRGRVLRFCWLRKSKTLEAAAGEKF